MCQQLFLKADVGLNELVELILSQNNVGSTIKVRAYTNFVAAIGLLKGRALRENPLCLPIY